MDLFSHFIIVDNIAWRRQVVRYMLIHLGFKNESISISDQSEILREVAGIQGCCCIFLADDKIGLAKELKALERVSKLFIVLVISGATGGKLASAFEAGMDGVLRQPCSAADLEALLNNLRLCA